LDYKVPLPFQAQIMDKQQCQNCEQRHNCQEVYRQMSDSKTPKVLSKTIQAFLVPLVIFIFVLAAAEKILAETLTSEAGKNFAALVMAVSAVFLYLVILNFWRRKN
jgi:hypothetical protein